MSYTGTNGPACLTVRFLNRHGAIGCALAMVFATLAASASVVIDMPAPRPKIETTYQAHKNGEARGAETGRVALNRYHKARRRPLNTYYRPARNRGYAATGYPYNSGYSSFSYQYGYGYGYGYGYPYSYGRGHHHGRHHGGMHGGHHPHVTPSTGNVSIPHVAPSSFRFTPGR